MTSQNTQSLDERETPKPQAGEWTLTAPDGRTWKADSPLKTAGYEQRERVPAEVAVERIFAACENAEPAGVVEAGTVGVSESPWKEKCPGAYSAGFDDRPWALVGGMDDLQAYQAGKAARLAATSTTPQPPTAEPGQTNEQGRAAEGAVSPCQHDHVPKVRCFACPETDDRKHCERDCLVVQRGTPDETEYLCQAWGETNLPPPARFYLHIRTNQLLRTWQAARSSPGAGLRLVPEVPNESVLLFLMGGLVEPQEADELQDEITQEEADAINDRCRTDARLHYAEILNIATKDAA